MMDQAQATRLWKDAVEAVKDNTLHPSLWRALDVSHGITLEDDTFIIGFTSADYSQASHLRSAQHRNVIEKILAETLGVSTLRIKTIEGTTIAEYQQVKKAEEKFEAGRRAMIQRQEAAKSKERGWDSVIEAIMRIHSDMHLRTLPQNRAKFMLQALSLVSDEMDKRSDNSQDDASERALARVLEKIALLIDTPSVLVATELIKMRNSSANF